MFRKDNLCIEILDKDCSLEDLQRMAGQSRFPQFEVRTVGPKGELQIKFPHREWVKPREWAINHTNTIVKEMYAAINRASKLTGLDDKFDSLGYVPKSQLKDVESEIRQKANQEMTQMMIAKKKEIISDTEARLKCTHFSWSEVRPGLDKIMADAETRLNKGETVSLQEIFNDIWKMYSNLES